ncbi:hypothetical protein EDB81DRAFT_751335 [Dactylonectria macrodidyma]|uniref:DUF7924 domain-containing protein n=1 Tax=Dactylonectria macrodidyma TaxID=307937 RepID=A0A9P9FTW0_9HYPO|nr:hypothetical protein EDB81DRAFT_751335 [Dactylonectria macrodidyma]
MGAHINSPSPVAKQHGRDSQCADQTSQGNHPARKIAPVVKPNPRKFWNRLPEIPVVRSTLKELRRQTAHSRPPFPPPPLGPIPDLSPALAQGLARLARHGGPDLCDLRGYPAKGAYRALIVMAHTSSSRSAISDQSESIRRRRAALEELIEAASEAQKTTPYSPGFDQYLSDHSAYGIQGLNLQDSEGVKAVLGVRRPSLSPSAFSDGAFAAFQNSNFEAKDDAEVKAFAITPIISWEHTEDFYALNTAFASLSPLIDRTLATYIPDMYYAPNFFLEIMGPSGTSAVVENQARYGGAIGARAMHALQNFGNDNQVFDEGAYTFSATYCAGTLKLYAHHVTAPTTPDGRLEYHMTKICGFEMTDSRATFVEGATAFRNLRDMARKYRDSFVQAANARIAPENSDPNTFPRPANARKSRPSNFISLEPGLPQQDVTNNHPLHLALNDGQATSSSHIPHPDEGVNVAKAVNDLPKSAGVGIATRPSSLRNRAKQKRGPEPLHEDQPSKIQKRRGKASLKSSVKTRAARAE